MIYISDLMDEASLVEAATVSLENSDVNNKATASVDESIALELVYHGKLMGVSSPACFSQGRVVIRSRKRFAIIVHKNVIDCFMDKSHFQKGSRIVRANPLDVSAGFCLSQAGQLLHCEGIPGVVQLLPHSKHWPC